MFGIVSLKMSSLASNRCDSLGEISMSVIGEGCCLRQTQFNRMLIFILFFPPTAKTEWNMKNGSEHKPKSFLHKPQDFAVMERIFDSIPAVFLSCSSHYLYPLSTNFHAGVMKTECAIVMSSDTHLTEHSIGS